jgi:outer membrane protein TolC
MRGLGVAAILLRALPVAAQPVSDARVATLVQQALAQNGASSQPAETRPAIDLRLDEALARALERNLDIQVERLNPETFDFTLAAQRAAYAPTVTSTLGQNNATLLPTSQLVGGQRVLNNVGTANIGAAQALPWYGTSLNLAWNNRKQDSTSSFNTFNPQYNSTLTATVTQPLLRGFRIDGTRQQLLVTRLNRAVSELQVQATITTTLAQVRTAYYDLTYTIAAVRVARQSLTLAEKLVDDNQVRVEVGTLAPIDVVQAEAEAATRRQALVQAEAAQRTAELALKRLVVGGTDDPLWTAALNPVDVPVFAPYAVDVVGAVRTALDARIDLQQARKTLEANDLALRLIGNQRLPALDLVGTYTLQGIAGTTKTVQTRFPDTLSAIGQREYPTWNVQVQVSYPLGTSAADAALGRARVQRAQAQAQIRAVELQIATEVTNFALQVQSNVKRVDASRAARELAQRRLEAEQSKFEVGMSTNFFVVQAQRDLADAQNNELRALLDYTKSIVDFERAQQTGLSRTTITAVTTAGAGGATVTR